MSERIDPVAALREIAYLMERVLAEPYRVRAFRSAADVIAALPPEEFERHALAGSWKQLAGVGDQISPPFTEMICPVM